MAVNASQDACYRNVQADLVTDRFAASQSVTLQAWIRNM